jgi:hypothetical protein
MRGRTGSRRHDKSDKNHDGCVTVVPDPQE